MKDVQPITMQPMVHVSDMASMVALLQALGGRVVSGSAEGDWAQIEVGGAEVGLLAHPPNPEQGEGDVELNFRAHGDLDEIQAAASDAGVEIASGVTIERFGRQLQLRNADGLLVKVNELDTRLIEERSD